MRWALYVVGLCLVVAAAFWSYRMTYGTKDVMAEVRTLRSEIRREREAIAILEAEWAWLNAPARLEALLEENRARLELKAMTPDRFAEIAEIAAPPIDDGMDPVAIIGLEEVGQAVSLGPSPPPRPRPDGLAPAPLKTSAPAPGGRDALYREVFE